MSRHGHLSAWRGRLRLAFALFTLGSAFACGPRPVPAPDDRGQRIVLITLDTLRQDSFLGYGDQPSTMPHTLARVQHGAWFPHFHSATSTTQPSHASMLTGQHPWEHGVSRNGLALPSAAMTVAELLRADGWSTAAAVASFPLESQFGLAQGFQRYDDKFRLDYDTESWEEREVPSGRFFNVAESMTDKAIQLLRGARGQRQLLWVHYFDPHAPYGKAAGLELRPIDVRNARLRDEPVEPVLTRLRKGYDQDVFELDRQLDRLLSRLDQDSDYFETHVVVASDHGESFGEHNSLGHGKRLHREQIVVPLFILSPRVSPGVRHEVAGSVDVAATLLALAGIDHPTSGRDLLANQPGRQGAFGMRRTYDSNQVYEELTTGEHRDLEAFRFFAVGLKGRIQRGNARRLDGEEQLTPEEAERFKSLFAHFEERLVATGIQPTLDAESRKAMSALGYLD